MAAAVGMCSGLVAMCAGICAVPVINESVITPVKNHISYAFTLDSKVETLNAQARELRDMIERLQQSVDEVTTNRGQIFPNVTEWLSTAVRDIGEADELIQGKEEAKKKCCVGFCANLKTRYQLSKKAHKKALAIEKLQNVQGLYPISFWTRPPPIIEVPSGEALQSRVEILNEIVEALKDPNLNPILVYGMGGIGKTTLAKEVLAQAVDLKLFHDVVLVAVSETPDLSRIQREIADALGLKFKADEAPGRARELHNRLNNDTKKVLIIFDDVWEELHLSDIGIPSGEPSKGCRIILTSRKKNVFCIEMPTKKEFPLGLLEEDEAWRLFENIVSIEFLANNRDFCDLGKQVVNKCGGLPLLIKIVATDLRNNKHLHAWRDMLKQLESVKGTEMYDKVHKVIESSYEKMKEEEAKSLFLLCPLFGNSNIQIYDLLIYCVGLGLCKRDSIEESRDRVLTLIDKLKNESLLLEGDMAGFVKIHDVVLDIATTIAAEKHFAFVGKGQIESAVLERRDLRRISLPYCEIPTLPGVLQCPEAEVFSVFSKNWRLYIPDLFFEGVRKLKVLHFAGLSFVFSLPSSHDSGDSSLVGSFSVLPSSLGLLTGLQTLSLDNCWGLTNVTIIAQLTQLKVLSFVGSNVQELPKEIKALAQLKLLDLTECRNLKVIPSNVLSNLNLLEELYVLSEFRGYDGWGTEGNASLEELKNLRCLKTLEIKVIDDKVLPEDWFFNGIQNFKISIGYDWFRFDARETSRRMLKLQLRTSIRSMHRIKEFLGEEAEVLYLEELNGIENLSCDSSSREKNSFQRLRVLKIKNNNSLREVLPFSKCLPHLQEMEVERCSNMEAVVCEGNEGGVMEFTQLTSLQLKELPNLIGICRTTRGMVSFPSLTSLKIYDCDSLKYVFTTSMVKSLKQLKKLKIGVCHSMEEIILVTECEEVIVFPQLKELEIRSCSSLKNFVGKDSDRSNNNEYFFNELVTLPNLEIMDIGWLGDFRYLWHQQFADTQSFSKLKSLEIINCRKLSIVFPSNVYRRFERLESLCVCECNAVKEIYEYEETNDLQPFALQRVKIVSLKSLKHIWSKDIDEAFSFQNLQSVIVRFCPELKYVIPASIACGLLQLQELKIRYCRVEMIIAEPKNGGSEGASIPTFEWPKLKRLKIYDCDELIRFGFIISKAKHNIATPDSVYFIQKVIPNVEVLKLDRYSLKAIQSDDHEFRCESLRKLKEVTLANFEEESVPVLFDFLRRSYSLEKLAFSYCCLGEILSLLDGRAVGDQQYNFGLKHLELDGVSKLKHIVKEDSQLNPISLCFQTLRVFSCNDMMNIAPPSSSSVSFRNLTTLHVDCCEKMTSLVTASTAKSMTQLMELQVFACDMMEDIIVANNYDGDCTEKHDDDDVITFHKLKRLELDMLPNLNSFCSAKYNFNFPLLKQVSIRGCNQMKNFCGREVSTPKLQEVGYEYEQLWEGNLNATIASQLQDNRPVDM